MDTLKFETLSDTLSVSRQLSIEDAQQIAELGFKQVICNRPDGEAEDQPASHDIESALAAVGVSFHRLFMRPGDLSAEAIAEFALLVESAQAPTLAYCRTGTRSAMLWSGWQAAYQSVEAILASIEQAGFELDGFRKLLQNPDLVGHAAFAAKTTQHDVVIVGGGAGGIAAAASLRRRDPELDIAIVEPSCAHCYQPGWTLVGAGVFKQSDTIRSMRTVMPKGVTWIRQAVTRFHPEQNQVLLDNGERVQYRTMIAAPGIKLDWNAVDGLSRTLGSNGVTSNYDIRHAPYTWELVKNLRSGRAVFTQPPMPIKCAGAPQKAMYLSCNAWERQGCLGDIDVHFHNAGGVLFGVPDYVPALESYVERYGANVHFNEKLVAVDGEARKAWFDTGTGTNKAVDFDLLHVSPPQTTPDFVRQSPLADEDGWIDVNPDTLRHSQFPNVFSLGDACSAPNAKTAAAVRKQAPVVAENVRSFLAEKPLTAVYDGYGSCPLTVERGKVVLAEFGYGGTLLPTAPKWLLDGTRPTWLGWFLKADMLPTIYYQLMLKGREWFAKPGHREAADGTGNGEAACDWDPGQSRAKT